MHAMCIMIERAAHLSTGLELWNFKESPICRCWNKFHNHNNPTKQNKIKDNSAVLLYFGLGYAKEKQIAYPLHSICIFPVRISLSSKYLSIKGILFPNANYQGEECLSCCSHLTFCKIYFSCIF